MTPLVYKWTADNREHELRLVPVPGTGAEPYLFGRGPNRKAINVPDFYISDTPVTQALWLHVMGDNPSIFPGPGLERPVENVSWNHINGPGSFLDKINYGKIRTTTVNQSGMRFRLPSETEWEYAARGGPSWHDDFIYSGSNEIDEVACYGLRWNNIHQAFARLVGFWPAWRIIGRLNRFRKSLTETQPVAAMMPNQLRIYDMSGNVWEWCEDVCIESLEDVPADGSPYLGPGEERRLRGGCHHNWNLHCTVSGRYGIVPDAHDGCIGFRLVLAPG